VSVHRTCRTLHCGVTGTKAILWNNIQESLKKYELEYNKKLETMRKKCDKKPTMPKCYISKDMRNKIFKDKMRKITASTAKSVHRLSEKDLEKLNCDYVDNPHYRSGPSMRLYRLIDVEKAVKEKYGSKKARDELFKNKDLASSKRNETRLQNIAIRKNAIDAEIIAVNRNRLFAYSDYAANSYHNNRITAEIAIINIRLCWNRYNELNNALNAQNCELRADSKLCADYLNCCSEYNLGEIVEIMVEMKFLFQYTNYSQIRQNLYRSGNYMYRDASEISEMAKKQAIRQIGNHPNMPESLRRIL
jgi:hypothetical protein